MKRKKAKARAPELAPGRGQYDRSLSAAERFDQQRARLVEAAAQVFADVGFARATVEVIVQRAGMSRRTFYEHFKDVKDALHHVHASLAGQAFQLLEGALKEITDPLERIRTGSLAFFGAIAANGALARVIFREVRAAGPEFETRWELETMRYVVLMLQAINEAHAKGLVSRQADELTVFALLAGAEAVAIRAVNRGEEAKLVEAAPQISELIIRAFK